MPLAVRGVAKVSRTRLRPDWRVYRQLRLVAGSTCTQKIATSGHCPASIVCFELGYDHQDQGSSARFTKLRHFRGRPPPELLYSARAKGCPVAFGAAMTRPATHQDTSNTKLDRSSTEFDSPSDCCDFGYDLVVVSGVQLKSNGVGKANPKPQLDPHRQFDPADH